MEVHHFLNNTGSPSAPRLSQVSTVDGSENVSWCENERAESPLRIQTYSEVTQEAVVVLHETQTSEASRITGGAVDDQAGAERIEASNGPSVRPKQQLGFDKATRSGDTAGGNTRKVNNTPVTDEDGFTQVNRKNKRFSKASPEDRKRGGDREGQQKGRRPGSVRGTKSVHNSRFKGSARTADIYIGNVDLESDVEDVMQYVQDDLQIKVIGCSELVSQYANRDWKSFKLTVDMNDRERLLQPDCWPESVNVRKYYVPKPKNKTSE
ncbi:hypothetical protein Pcinc_008458 [Petrolisthes cinctipes]|uniref:Uncharacterized protein n=1 Tax=Petrolisthes cinctipes TaxID=88211 RepID=A0AAE1G8V8_PETCI|nr:hypothetical protein Pcinc_008458 [Petrolisthes cinctipes]